MRKDELREQRSSWGQAGPGTERRVCILGVWGVAIESLAVVAAEAGEGGGSWY